MSAQPVPAGRPDWLARDVDLAELFEYALAELAVTCRGETVLEAVFDDARFRRLHLKMTFRPQLLEERREAIAALKGGG